VVQIEESIDILLPLEDVFMFAAHPENMPRWNPVVKESTLVGSLEEGATVRQSIDVLGRRFGAVYEVTRYEPFRAVEFTCTDGPVEVQGRMEFRRVGGATRIQWTVVGDCRGFLRVAEGVLIGLGRPEMRACLENLKLAVEHPETADFPIRSEQGAGIRAPSLISHGRAFFTSFVGSVAGRG
jgi:carbon monoxide dehydrogenase subunit G